MKLVLVLLVPSLAAAGPWEASGGQCGINSTCAVGALTATSFTNSGNEMVTGTLGVTGATTVGALVAGDEATNSVDAGFIRNTGALVQVGQVTASAGAMWNGTVASNGTNVFAPGGNAYAGFSSTAALAMAGSMSGNPTIYYLGSGNGGADLLIQDAGTIGLGANLRVTAAGGLLGSGASLGLLQVDTTNSACSTVCQSVDAGTCAWGQNLAALTYKDVSCSDTTADNCMCLGHPP